MYYLREGHWCVCECSCNWSNGLMNDGISVYACLEVESGKWKPIGSSWEYRGGADFQSGTLPWFLVSGTPTGLTGGDSEPLIKMVKAHFKLGWTHSEQAFTVAQPATFVPSIIHEQIDDQCRFPAGEFEAMHAMDFDELVD